MDDAKLAERYGASETGAFRVSGTIGVPHPYVIGPRHVAHAADRFGGMLGREAIEHGEREGIRCEARGCRLNYADHKAALLVTCGREIKGSDGMVDPELHAYLLKCKPLAEADHYDGFAFVKD